MLAYFNKAETLSPDEALERLRADGPGGAGRFMALGAWREGVLAGYAAFSTVYAFDTGAGAVCLSDCYVRQPYRRQGIGRNLMAALARLCVERGWGRIEWHVDRLDFDARTFFDMLNPDGFKLDRLSYLIEGEELSYLIEGEEIAALAGKTDI